MNDIGNSSLEAIFFGEFPSYEDQRTEDKMTNKSYTYNIKIDELINDIKNLQPQQQLSSCKESIKLLLSLYKELKQKATIPLPKRLPNPGDDYPRYPGRENAIEWLKMHWKAYLKYFGATENLLFQDQLGKLDSNLLQALKNQISRDNRNGDSNIKLSQIVPPKKDRITHEIKNLSSEDIKEFNRMKSVVRQGFRSGLLPKRTQNLG